MDGLKRSTSPFICGSKVVDGFFHGLVRFAFLEKKTSEWHGSLDTAALPLLLREWAD